MGARGLEWFLWTYCKAVAVVLFCAEPRELRLRVTDSSPCRHMSGPSLTREGELFELNVAVGEQEVISLGPVPRRFPPPLLMGYAKEKKSRLSLRFLAGRWMIRGAYSRKDWLCQGRMAKQGREAGLPSLRLRQGKPAFAKASENPSTQGVQGKKKGPAKGRVFGSSCLRYCYGKASRPSLRLRQAGLRAKKNKTRSTQSDVRDECSCLSQSYRTRCPDSIGISESGPYLDACSDSK